MDSRDLLVLGGVGVGLWFLYKHFQQAPQPAVSTNPAGASSMVAGAAAQTQVGAGPALAGVISGGGSFFKPTFGYGASSSNAFRTSAATLLSLNFRPGPVAIGPVPPLSSPTAGVAPTPGVQPPPQQLSPVIHNSRGIY